ncbi:MAG: menaquinol oxidoreductase [Desulfuromonadales bacterium]|nr:menaquinol oxidoreductase [Desulfuromonadales bacterium]
MAQTKAPAIRQSSGHEDQRQEIEARLRRHERSAGHGLWGMVIFLTVSIAAFNDFALLPDLPEQIRRSLGTPPPAEMISLALVVYAFSGIVYILARTSHDVQPFRGLIHAGFLLAFYAFYHLSGVLTDNFWAVFFAGLSVLGLDNYYLWQNSSSAIRREKALLDRLDKGLPIYRTDQEDEA